MRDVKPCKRSNRCSDWLELINDRVDVGLRLFDHGTGVWRHSRVHTIHGDSVHVLEHRHGLDLRVHIQDGIVRLVVEGRCLQGTEQRDC